MSMGGATGEGPEDERDPLHGGETCGQGGPEAGDGEDAIDASLQVALSDLERMLDDREGDAEGDGGRGPEPADMDDDGEQYTIPLLDEVVIPGPSPVVPPAPSSALLPESLPLDDDEPAVRARIAARIASEMDVIMQDRIERALDEVREEIRDRVRDHMDIILPEIVDELVQARKRQGGS